VSLELLIVTPQGTAWRGSVKSVVLPGSEGDFGVLEHHERFLTPLRVGEVRIEAGAQTLYAALSDGFADVSGAEVAVMVESCELASSIDVARAELARERAEAGLARLGADETAEHLAAYEAAVARARNRLAVARRGSS
jgi:F-type H+-transporting ATPase subunit epsilon